MCSNGRQLNGRQLNFLIMYLKGPVKWWNYSEHKLFLPSVYFWQVQCFHEDKLCQAACSAHTLVYSLRMWGLAFISKWGQGKTSISLHHLAAFKKKKRKKRQAEWETQQSSQQLGPVWLWPGPVKVDVQGEESFLCSLGFLVSAAGADLPAS